MAKKHLQCPVAVHIFFIKNDHVLLLKRYNTGFEDGKYSVVAGHLDGGETVKQAAIREAKEEANLDLTENQLNIVGVMHRNSDEERIDFFCVASSWKGTLKNMEPHKCDELAFYPLHSLPENMIPYIRQSIDLYQKGITFSSYGW